MLPIQNGTRAQRRNRRDGAHTGSHATGSCSPQKPGHIPHGTRRGSTQPFPLPVSRLGFGLWRILANVWGRLVLDLEIWDCRANLYGCNVLLTTLQNLAKFRAPVDCKRANPKKPLAIQFALCAVQDWNRGSCLHPSEALRCSLWGGQDGFCGVAPSYVISPQLWWLRYEPLHLGSF